MYGYVFKISFNEYSRDNTYLNVFLTTSCALFIGSIGLMEYFNERLDYVDYYSNIDQFLYEMRRDSFLI